MPAWAIFHRFYFGINAAWLTVAMTGQILLAWLKLLALDGDLAKAAQDTALPCAAHRRPPGPRRAETASENPGHLAMGRSDHGRVAAHRRAPASPLTSENRPCDPGRTIPRAYGTPVTRPGSRAIVIPRR
jgi:hypothetical protein